MSALRRFWRLLRAWSGDDAYERYLSAALAQRDGGRGQSPRTNASGMAEPSMDPSDPARPCCADHGGHGHALLDRREFYRRYFDRRANRPRCC